jgi:hypothetical protein
VWINRISREPSGSEMTRSTRRLETWTLRASDGPVAVAHQKGLTVERLFGAVVLALDSLILSGTSQ